MQPANKIIFRKYQPRDRLGLRQIVYDTAFMGEPAGKFFDGQEVITDALSLYFTDYEPEASFVAELDGQILAYLIGTKDKPAAERTFNRKIALPLLFKGLKQGVLLRPKNLLFFIRCLKDALVNGIRTPDVTLKYPATFHLNVKSGFRGLKIGPQLIKLFLEYLGAAQIKGVHLATLSDQAAGFFLNQGFTRLYQGKRSYFRNILHRDVPLYILGRRL